MQDVIREYEHGYSPTQRLALYRQNKSRAYKSCQVAGKSRQVHRMVASLFCYNPRPDIFLEVDHIDRNHANNHWKNLRWVNRLLNRLNRKGSDSSRFESKYLELTGIRNSGVGLWRDTETPT